MTRSLSLELAPFGIRVNSVLPGFTRNKTLDSHLKEYTESERLAYVNKISSDIPLKRIAEPEDIGWAAVFLASDEAGFITGTSLTVDGGASVHL